MLECIKLKYEHLSLISDLWLNKEKIFKDKVDQDYLNGLKSKIEKIFSQYSNQITVYGIMQQGVLIATWSVFRWTQLPYYTIEELVIHNPEKSVTRYKKVINLLLSNIHSDMEKEKRYTFYILAMLRNYQKSSLVKGENWSIPEDLHVFDRYNLFVEAIIPANTQPQKVYWDMMGHKFWEKDLWIRRGCLKDKFLIPMLMQELE